jgi:hypothetical protein
MVGACGSYVGDKKYLTFIGEETLEIPLGRLMHGWVDNINTAPKELGMEDVNCIHEDRDTEKVGSY